MAEGTQRDRGFLSAGFLSSRHCARDSNPQRRKLQRTKAGLHRARLIAWSVGGLLWVAAVFKLDGLRLDLAIRGERIWSDWFTLLVIKRELALGAALVLGAYRLLAWRATIGTFLCFLV